jgi:hypothetical protein
MVTMIGRERFGVTDTPEEIAGQVETRNNKRNSLLTYILIKKRIRK